MEHITLRDQFAIHAPTSAIRNIAWDELKDFLGLPKKTPIREWDIHPEYTLAWEAHCRYQYADAMIRGREGDIYNKIKSGEPDKQTTTCPQFKGNPKKKSCYASALCNSDCDDWTKCVKQLQGDSYRIISSPQ